MKTITIGFSTPKKKKIGASLIKLWIGASYSHVFIQFHSDSLEIDTVYHAAHGMVHFRSYENFLKDNMIVKSYKIGIDIATYKSLLRDLCFKLAGEPYDYSDLLQILCVDILYRIGVYKIKTYDGKGYICSELAGLLCTEYLNMVFKKPIYLLTPKDIDEGLNLIGLTPNPL